jgi:site-specific recombinase XerD
MMNTGVHNPGRGNREGSGLNDNFRMKPSKTQLPAGMGLGIASGPSVGLSTWVDGFVRSCRARNLASGTVDFYTKKLGKFVAYCHAHRVRELAQVTTEDVRQFLTFLGEGGHNPAGVHCFYRAIKTFLRWYEREMEPDAWRNPISKVKAPIVPLEPLDPVSVDTVKSLVNACQDHGQLGSRDKAMLLFLLDSGVRLAELLALNREDVDIISGTVQIRAGKGRKPRLVYLGDKSRQMLRRYLRQRRDLNPALWISRFGERLTESGLRMMLRRRAAEAAVPEPSPHDFRRAFALERWRAGIDILTLSKLMGHASLQVLTRYLKQAGEDLEKAAKQSSPVDRNF